MVARIEERVPVEINASRSSPNVEIVWNDGHKSVYTVGKLREICPCATCREASGEPAHQTLVTHPPTSSTSKESKEPGTKPRRSLQMFKPEKYQIEEMYFVGNYALGINWQDKHKSIYPWLLLGEI